jgi:hypothetical protein
MRPVVGTLCVDRINPVGNFTSPAAGNVSGVITVAVNATDNDKVASVQFKLDGANLGGLLTVAPFQVGYDTRSSLNGPHTFSAVITDRLGNTTTISQAVTMANVPVVTITAPSAGNVGGVINLTATVTSYDASISVQFRVDGSNLGAAQTAAPFAYNGYDTRSLLNGAHTFSVVATDGHGNTTTQTVNVNFVNAPVVTITAPGNGATISGVWNYTATITSYDASCSTQFKLDGGNFGSAQSGGGGLGFTNQDSRSILNGAHTLQVTSVDGHGNTTSASISVTMANKPAVTITSPGNGATVTGLWNFTATVAHYSSSCSTQFRIDGGNYGGAQSGAGSLGWTGQDSHTLAAGGHTLSVISTDAQGNTTTVSIPVTVGNSPPGGGQVALGNYQEFWPDDGAYEDGRWDYQFFNNRFSPNFIWSQTGDKYSPRYLPGNPDPTHYQMYIQQYTTFCEAGVGGDIAHLDLILNGNRYQDWNNGPQGSAFGPVYAVGGGDSVYWERYQDNASNSAFTQGLGVNYWFAVKPGYLS